MDNIIYAVNSQVKQTAHKYGLSVPRSVEEAYALDKKNGNNLCRDSLDK